MKVNDMLREVTNLGITTTSLAKNAGISQPSMSKIIYGKVSLVNERKLKLQKALEQKVFLLENFNPEEHDVYEVCEKVGMPTTKLADFLGISKQAVHQFLIIGFPEERMAEIVKYFKKTAKALSKLSGKLK